MHASQHTHTHTGKVHLASNVGMACCKDENKLTVVRYLRLAAVPDNTPLPMTMLSKLWQLSGEQEAEQCANLLQQLGVMRVAFLYDSSAWALVDIGHLKHLQVSCTQTRLHQSTRYKPSLRVSRTG